MRTGTFQQRVGRHSGAVRDGVNACGRCGQIMQNANNALNDAHAGVLRRRGRFRIIDVTVLVNRDNVGKCSADVHAQLQF